MSLLSTNTLQLLLMEESELQKSDWIELYSQRFREIIEKGVKSIDDIKLYLYQN